MTDCRPIDSSMDTVTQIKNTQPGLKFRRYQRLLGKLIYLTITRQDISSCSWVSHFMQSPHNDHGDAMIRILRYIGKGTIT